MNVFIDPDLNPLPCVLADTIREHSRLGFRERRSAVKGHIWPPERECLARGRSLVEIFRKIVLDDVWL